MKKVLVTLAALGLSAGLPQAAHAMECCKDGPCKCCIKEESTDEPAPEGHAEH